MPTSIRQRKIFRSILQCVFLASEVGTGKVLITCILRRDSWPSSSVFCRLKKFGLPRYNATAHSFPKSWLTMQWGFSSAF